MESRYDGAADWYDATFTTSELGLSGRAAVLRLLGAGPGTLLDVGCGGGSHMLAFAEAGWQPVGVDASSDQLRLARRRGCEVVHGDAAALPFADASFDAAVSMWTHTDLDGFATVLREVARVLRPGGAFVYLGVHPCFVGPHARFAEGKGVPELYPGYRRRGRYDGSAPGVTTEGLRARVGGTHLPLAPFVQAFLDAGLRLERLEEPDAREYPVAIAIRALRSE